MNELYPSNRVAKLLAVPASVSVICGLSFTPPRLAVPAAPAAVAQSAPAVVPQRTARKPAPRIIAIDGRIARRVNALQPGVKRRLQEVVRRLPGDVQLLVTSARRTRAEQAALHPTFGVKARPGTSAHEDGRAIDVNVIVDGERVSPRLNQRIIGAAMASVGFVYLGRIDPVHYSLPKTELKLASGKLPERGPDLDVPTMHEVREIIAAQNAQDAVTLTPVTAFAAEEPVRTFAVQ